MGGQSRSSIWRTSSAPSTTTFTSESVTNDWQERLLEPTV
jgi:hypothetical protein